jgi:ferritin-like metal-binding protein YciE
MGQEPRDADAFCEVLEGDEGPDCVPEAGLRNLGREADTEHCNGMEGVIKEGADALEKDEEGASCNSGIVVTALKTEHYEIVDYTATIAMAKILG